MTESLKDAMVLRGRRPSRLPGSGRAAIAVLALMTLAAAALWPWSAAWYDVQEIDSAVRRAPSWKPAGNEEAFLARLSREPVAFRASWITQTLAGARSLLGHDDLGRSLLFRLALGMLVSLVIAAGATATATVIGTAWGAAAGLCGGRVDQILMRIVDVLYGLPYILLVILMKVALTRPLTALLGGRTRYADLVILFLAIGSVAWLTMARVVRGQVLSLKHEGFVQAARAMGAGPWWILRKHLLPPLAGPVIVYATLTVPQAVLQEAFLSFLGIGVQPPLPSLGRLAADGVSAISPFSGYWWLLAFPCATLVALLLALSGLGDGLRRRFDPANRHPSLLG
ncbi:MAG: ABC transporter permease [Phycisphaerae bacterium]|nr:MAG: ABC transporter permease [Planctomycetota bacterium]KAB2941485.1 MAG: ABC transporter permease [Phycisphaerae bacterium]MBE7455021.1 ABC transporter permease [Planctomycetia bacterium]MCK6464744.1 ABC transporter permease [Phycisphaerae bacterium]MCL4718920.1 ABC transporter permease [Phycisphaerae bacterium]